MRWGALILVLLAGSAQADPAHPTDDCIRCHTAQSWRALPDRVAFDHASTGFPLVGLHAGARCVACHGAGLSATDQTPTACVRCHEDRHQGTLGRDCERCHAPSGWRIPTAVLDHRATRFPLAGAHIAADCSACHRRAREGVWAGAPTQCFACHADDWRRQDVHPNHAKAGFSTSCDLCHTQYTWAMPRLRHELFYPLSGAHAVAACTGCHKGERYGGTPTACVACHRQDYDTAADPPHAATRMPLDCARCHTSVSWSAQASGWHEASFPINRGKHSGFTCAQCHTRPGSWLDFSCMACHQKGPTGGEHGGVGGYVYENHACWACHPRGDD